MVQKEFKFALKVLQEFPENKVYFIPVRLDECEVPANMAEIQWVSLFEPDGYEKLVKALSLYTPPVVVQRSEELFKKSESLSIEYKERGRNEVREWGKKIAEGKEGWHHLGNALEDYLDAIKYNPYHQHPWTNIAYVYYLIGEIEIAKKCLQRSYELAEPGPNHPGRNYKNVKEAIDQNRNLSGSKLVHPPIPGWFKEKYKDFLNIGLGMEMTFKNVGFYLQSK